MYLLVVGVGEDSGLEDVIRVSTGEAGLSLVALAVPDLHVTMIPSCRVIHTYIYDTHELRYARRQHGNAQQHV